MYGRMVFACMLSLAVFSSYLPAWGEEGRSRDVPRPFGWEAGVMEKIRKESPREYEKLLELKRKNPAAYRSRLRRRMRSYVMEKGGRMVSGEVRERMKEIAALEKELRKMVSRYRAASKEEERAAVRKKIRQTIEKIFSLRQQNFAAMIERLEQQLQRLKKQLSDREERKEEIINARLRRMIGGDEEKKPTAGRR